ncbi:hypothetical protein PoMZ_08620 [Pyricularia oryzae]|uniref:DUF4246 domain-containing protein n=1 Tax=Pyricularia oryzae TaxID=318829 RepID=A0A4P7NIB1_PYROR|nr:hypothetical protein PoMZ_08620 [Pyricularia oryzae]
MGFQEDGSLKFTSYGNSLHPTRYPEIYRVIETLATTALPLWDQCLAVNVSYKRRPGPEDCTGGGRLKGLSMPVTQKESNKPYHRPAFDQDSEDIEESEGEEDEQEEEDRLLDAWEALRSPILPDPEFIAVD